MRPLELELRNFRSYYGEGARFDFRARRLIGIVGPIGSGKSSLLDAIAFALYGKTPTSGSNRKSLINQRSNDMAVRFRFQAGDEVWEVVRSLRRKGQAQHALYRLGADGPTEAATPGAAGEVVEILEKITMDGPVSERIVDLLGLDYEAFGRSVMLAQNRFSEFLSAGATQRDVVLKGVFGHDRIDDMRVRSKTALSEAEGALEKLAIRTDQLESVAVRLAETKLSRKTHAERLGKLGAAQPEVEALEQRRNVAAEAAKAARGRLDGLTGKGEAVLPSEQQTDVLLEAAASAAKLRSELAAVLEERGEQLATAETRLAELTDAGEDALIDKAAALITQRTMQLREVDQAAATLGELDTELAATTARIGEMDARLRAAQTLVTSTTVSLEEATRTAKHAADRLAGAERSDMAHTLRATLTSGEPCPVCEQQVSTIPATAENDAVVESKVALDHAVDHRKAAESAHTEAITALRSLDEEHKAQGVTRQHTEARRGAAVADLANREKDLGHVAGELDALLGSGDHTALLETRRARRAELMDAVKQRKGELDKARQAHEHAVRDGQSVDREMAGLVTQLVTVGAKLGVPVEVQRDRPNEVAEAVAAIRGQWTDVVDGLRKDMADGDAEVANSDDELSRLLERLEVERSLREEIASVESALAMLDQAIERDEGELAASESLLEEKAAAERRVEVYGRLSEDLRDSQFVRFLLDEERTRLAALGSEHFMRLSSGRYAFSDDGEFSIVDLTSADAVRKAASLSGGETFLASLALALALAEMVARTGGRLDAFFLDEGFGSLDAEHLDLAMEGIEALVTDERDRLVVVVSHVPELRHRIDDRIQLDRDPLTGDTKVVQA